MSESIVLNQNSEEIIYLSKRDKRLAKVFSMVGEMTYKPHDDGYAFLIRTILGQMISAKVATIICERFTNLCCGKIDPETVSKLSDNQIKEVGTSNSKTRFIREITESVITGKINLDSLKEMKDEEVFTALTSIYGIGKWTAEMYLIFVLNRQDILPFDDSAFIQAYDWLYKTTDNSKNSIAKKCRKWKPYSSIATRYLYRALDMGFTKEEFHLYKNR